MSRAVAIAVAVVLCCCNSGAESPPADPGSAPPPAPRVVFHTALGDVAVTVEVADDAATRARGLMYRTALDPNAGMIFIFPNESEHSFWMKNTYIALDMIFADANKNVVGVVRNAEPLTETARSIGVPSLYVIEVNAGFADRHAIDTGVGFSLENVAATTLR
ncbi:MAG: DUF192 domain-containing protein [Deltaproteobacteria bacterium]|nr:DUF192 domain-containing protein [Deltaproteobacteria bacterium]